MPRGSLTTLTHGHCTTEGEDKEKKEPVLEVVYVLTAHIPPNLVTSLQPCIKEEIRNVAFL